MGEEKSCSQSGEYYAQVNRKHGANEGIRKTLLVTQGAGKIR